MAMAVGGRADAHRSSWPSWSAAGTGRRLSPFAPTGIIVTGLMNKINLGGHELRTYLSNLIAHAIVAFGGYLLFGGWRLFKSRDSRAAEEVAGTVEFTAKHGMTLAVIGCVLIAVLFLNANIGMAAFTGAVASPCSASPTTTGDSQDAVDADPDGGGMSVLVALLEKTKGSSASPTS
jgi:hypothetical protein